MREQIIALLESLPPDRKLSVGDREAKIVCPNPEHAGGNEANPSFGICIEEGPKLGQLCTF